MPDDVAVATIGHNRAPVRDVLAEAGRDLLARLTLERADLAARRDELLESCANVPAVIEAEDIADMASDQASQIAKALKSAEAHRVSDKEPALSAEREIDGFYKKVTDPLVKAKAAIEGRLTIYQRKKADEERKRRQEEERLAELRAQEERARQQEAERLRQEAERRAREEAEAAAKAAEDEAGLQAAIEAENRAATLAVENARKAEEDERAARQAEADAATAAKAADAKPVDMSRVRGTYGSLSSLKTFWDFKDLDRAALDLDALRPHLGQDALEKAVRAYIKANAPFVDGAQPVRGVHFFENNKTQVR